MELVVVTQGGCEVLEAELATLLDRPDIHAVMLFISTECNVHP